MAKDDLSNQLPHATKEPASDASGSQSTPEHNIDGTFLISDTSSDDSLQVPDSWQQRNNILNKYTKMMLGLQEEIYELHQELDQNTTFKGDPESDAKKQKLFKLRTTMLAMEERISNLKGDCNEWKTFHETKKSNNAKRKCKKITFGPKAIDGSDNTAGADGSNSEASNNRNAKVQSKWKNVGGAYGALNGSSEARVFSLTAGFLGLDRATVVNLEAKTSADFSVFSGFAAAGGAGSAAQIEDLTNINKRAGKADSVGAGDMGAAGDTASDFQTYISAHPYISLPALKRRTLNDFRNESRKYTPYKSDKDQNKTDTPVSLMEESEDKAKKRKKTAQLEKSGGDSNFCCLAIIIAAVILALCGKWIYRLFFSNC